jgi:6-phosphogluconolactonase (cycloisomerase 2 family)
MRFRQLLGGMTAAGAMVALSIPGVATAHERSGGYVYTETNGAAGNVVLAYARGWDGSLSPIGAFATGGLGSGGGLGSQGALSLTDGGRWLLAVNAGSNDVSVFRVRDDGRLALTDRTDAAGSDPISVTAHDGVAYVLDAGGAGNIAGFRIGDGRLRAIAGSVQPLSGSGTNPAEVAFSTDGRFLVVTERATNRIDTYRVGDWGRAGSPVTTASSGPVPYGFAFDRHDHPIVSEAVNSTLSSYRLGAAGASVISASVPTGGLAACWVAVSPDGRWAFDANAHGGTISSFAVARDGSISLAQSVAADTGAGSAPLDLGVSSDGRFLYVVEAGSHAIGGYALGAGGSLAAVPGQPAIPAGTSGIAVS